MSWGLAKVLILLVLALTIQKIKIKLIHIHMPIATYTLIKCFKSMFRTYLNYDIYHTGGQPYILSIARNSSTSHQIARIPSMGLL